MLSAKIVNLKMYTLHDSIYITFSNDRTIEKEDRPVVAGNTNREVSPGCDYREVMQGSSFVMMGVLYFTVPEYTVNSTDTAAKSLQSCPTLCDPMDGSPPGSPVPGILQARTLEWVAISFSNA